MDLACCFGQDIRILVFDGAPAENITGSELEQGFIDLGYELFKDRDKLGAKFTSGGFFAAETAGLQAHSFDIIHAAGFYHLFTWDEQVEAISKTLRLLRPTTGSMLLGRLRALRTPAPLRSHRLVRARSIGRILIASANFSTKSRRGLRSSWTPWST